MPTCILGHGSCQVNLETKDAMRLSMSEKKNDKVNDTEVALGPKSVCPIDKSW